MQLFYIRWIKKILRILECSEVSRVGVLRGLLRVITQGSFVSGFGQNRVFEHGDQHVLALAYTCLIVLDPEIPFTLPEMKGISGTDGANYTK